MKIFITVMIMLGGIQSFGQKIDSLFSERNLPKGLTVTVKTDSGLFSELPGKDISTVTFKTGGASVYYYVFEYHPSDSTVLRDALYKYWIVSGCNVVLHKDFDKNFKSFIKHGYYFLPQRCACKTIENKYCALLAKRINQWSK